METSELLEDLTALLEQTGIEVRKQPMGGGGGGTCRIKDKTVFFLDTECSMLEMAVNCAREVASRIDIESIYLRPQVRQFLEKYGH